MMSNSRPIRGLHVNPAAKYAHCPDSLILDLCVSLQRFKEEALSPQSTWRWQRAMGWTLESKTFDWSMNDALMEILSHINMSQDAEAGLEALGQEMTYFFRDSEALARSMVDLGYAIYRQLLHLGVYGEDGVLPYQFCKEWLDEHTPVFSKVTYEDL